MAKEKETRNGVDGNYFSRFQGETAVVKVLGVNGSHSFVCSLGAALKKAFLFHCS